LVVLIVVLLMLSAFFSATETALMSLNRYRLRAPGIAQPESPNGCCSAPIA
jgi:Mg2+/Co2+ transporter CorB